MKKNLILMLLAMIAVFRLCAEPVTMEPVAALNHNGQVTQYYGTNALQAAHNDAVSGDTITLNSGSFSPCTITKGITLRGACMGTTPEMEEHGMRPTIINADMRIRIPSTETNTLKIEDMCFDKKLYVDSVPHISFKRVKTSQDMTTTTPKKQYFDAVQCIFYRIVDSRMSTIVYSFVNSSFSFGGGYPWYVYAYNCVLGRIVSYESDAYSYMGIFENCIFTYNSGNSLPDNVIVKNCVAVTNIFRYCQASECKVSTLAELFGDQENTAYQYGGYTKPLTEEAAATYLGNDGSQVGIYGGLLPFTMMNNNPVVTMNDIAEETTEDGKLRVKIEVKSN